MKTIEPTPEGQHILDLHRDTTDNILIIAYAGCGKTTMLEMIMEQEKENTLYLCFNTRNKDEALNRIQEKMEHGWPLPPIEVKTLNALGHRVWSKEIDHRLTVEIDESTKQVTKTRNILHTIINNLQKDIRDEAWEVYSQVTEAVRLAKAFGYIPEGNFNGTKRLISLEDFTAKLDEDPSDLVLDLLDETLLASIKASYAGSIDFDDQIYMPALFGGTYPRFPLVLVDERQDLSPTNHAMLRHLKDSRIIAVGDDAQSIYQFRGAQQGGMAIHSKDFNCTEATLSVSFRCPQAIVENARWRVPDMKWMKDGGKVDNLRSIDPDEFMDGGAILCRNNAPLLSVAFKLLSRGRSVYVGGSDVGAKVINIMRKLGPDELSQIRMAHAIQDWREEKRAKGSTTADDYADCMLVFAHHGDTLRQAIAHAEYIFRQKGSLSLLTGHKAKGMEWENVYHLDPHLLRQQDEQDRNLRYVIETRSLNNLFTLHSESIQWEDR